MPTPSLIGLTGRAIRLKFGKHPYFHTIMEDILCANSKVFRELLEPNRKACDDCDCPICYNRIKPDIETIVHCRAHNGCGQNMHASYLEKWHKLESTDICPYCRTKWANDQNGKRFVIEAHQYSRLPWDSATMKTLALEEVVGVWLHYIYSGTLKLDMSIREHKDHKGVTVEWIAYLFRLFILADVLRDSAFKAKILEHCLKLKWGGNSTKSCIVDWTYRWANLPKDNALRTFVVDVICAKYEGVDSDPQELENIMRDSPWLAPFVADIGIECIRGNERPLEMDHAAMIDKYGSDEPAVGFRIRAIESTANPRVRGARVIEVSVEEAE